MRIHTNVGMCLSMCREYSLRHWNHVSLVYWKPLLEVQLPNTSAACTVRVTNPQRDSNATKLKACPRPCACHAPKPPDRQRCRNTAVPGSVSSTACACSEWAGL